MSGLWRQQLLEQGMNANPREGLIWHSAPPYWSPTFHGDPADRLIVATALEGHQLITADERILAWPGNLDCLRADGVRADRNMIGRTGVGAGCALPDVKAAGAKWAIETKAWSQVAPRYRM